MIDKLQKLINESNNIVFFGGAGVSTESGLKDFRGKNGLYKEKKQYKYDPEYMLSIGCLITNPDLFFEYYKDKMHFSNVKPNSAHYYLAKLEKEGKLKAVVTQNIDGLHEDAGSKNIFELHGTTRRAYCMKCNKQYDGDFIFNSKGIPRCECGGIVRPDIVLYGEMLNDSYNEAAYYISKCDLLIVGGSSLTVEPAAGLVRNYPGKLVIINQDETPYDFKAELVMHEPIGEVFSKLK